MSILLQYNNHSCLQLPYEITRELIFSGVKFQYESYDYKKALEEIEKYKINDNYYNIGNGLFYFVKNDPVPNDIKQKCIIWRIGKLRQIYFDNDGRIKKYVIGNRRNKTFYLYDFGIKVKPIIFKSDDKFDLINQGFAIEDTI